MVSSVTSNLFGWRFDRAVWSAYRTILLVPLWYGTNYEPYIPKYCSSKICVESHTHAHTHTRLYVILLPVAPRNSTLLNNHLCTLHPIQKKLSWNTIHVSISIDIFIYVLIRVPFFSRSRIYFLKYSECVWRTFAEAVMAFGHLTDCSITYNNRIIVGIRKW